MLGASVTDAAAGFSGGCIGIASLSASLSGSNSRPWLSQCSRHSSRASRSVACLAVNRATCIYERNSSSLCCARRPNRPPLSALTTSANSPSACSSCPSSAASAAKWKTSSALLVSFGLGSSGRGGSGDGSSKSRIQPLPSLFAELQHNRRSSDSSLMVRYFPLWLRREMYGTNSGRIGLFNASR